MEIDISKIDATIVSYVKRYVRECRDSFEAYTDEYYTYTVILETLKLVRTEERQV